MSLKDQHTDMANVLPPVSPEELIAKLEKIQKIQTEFVALITALNRVAMLAETDPDGKITFVNELFCMVSGYEARELIGKNFSVLKSGHQHESIFDDLWKTITENRVWQGRLKNKAKDGAFFWVDNTIIPQLNSKNQIKKYISVSFNITQVMETGYQTPKLNLLPAYSPLTDAAAQQVLALQQQLTTTQNEWLALRQAMDASVLVSETDKRGIITAVNDLFVFKSGYSRHELIGQNHRLLKSEEMKGEVYDELWRVISNGQVWKGMLQNKTKGGKSYWIESTITPLTDTDGKVERYIAVSYDITDWKEKSAQAGESSDELTELRSEVLQLKAYNHELEELQTLLYSQVAALNNAAIVAEMNLDGHFLFVNDNYLRVSGYSRDELMNGSQELIPNNEMGAYEEAWTTIRGGGSWTGLIKNQKKSGEIYYTYTTVTPILNDQRIVTKYVAIQYNLTENIERIQSAETLSHELKALNDALTQEKLTLEEQKSALEEEKRNSTIFLSAVHQSVMITEMDLNGRITIANNLFVWFTETGPLEIIGKELLPFFFKKEDELPTLEELLQAQEQQKWVGIIGLKSENGKEYTVKAGFIPIFNDLGEVIRFVCLFTDITNELDKAEQEKIHLENELLSLKTIFTDLQDYNSAYHTIGLQVELTPEKNIVALNNAFSQATLYELEDISQLPFENILSDESIAKIPSDFWSSESNDVWTGSLLLKTKDEKNLLCNATINRIYKNGVLHRFLITFLEGTEALDLVERFKSENLNLRKEEQEILLKYQQLQTDFLQEKEARKNLELETDQLKKQVLNLELERTEKENEITSLKQTSDAIEDLKAKWLEEINARILAEQANEALKLQLENAIAEKEKIAQTDASDAEHLNQQIQKLEKQLSEVQKMAQEYKLSEDSLRLKWHQTIADLSLTKSQIKKLGEMLNAQRLETETAQKALNESEAEILTLKAQEAELQRIIEKLKNRTDESEPDIEVPIEAAPSTIGFIMEQIQDPTSMVGSVVSSLMQSGNVTDIQVEITSESVEDEAVNTEETIPPPPINVILIQSDVNDLEASENRLNEAGYKVSSFQYGREALESFEKQRPDVLLMEIKLPDLNGFDLTDIIRNDYDDNQTPIYALVEESHTNYINDYLSNGFTGIIVLPLQIESLKNVLGS